MTSCCLDFSYLLYTCKGFYWEKAGGIQKDKFSHPFIPGHAWLFPRGKENRLCPLGANICILPFKQIHSSHDTLFCAVLYYIYIERDNGAEEVTPFHPFNSKQHLIAIPLSTVLREVKNKITKTCEFCDTLGKGTCVLGLLACPSVTFTLLLPHQGFINITKYYKNN